MADIFWFLVYLFGSAVVTFWLVCSLIIFRIGYFVVLREYRDVKEAVEKAGLR